MSLLQIFQERYAEAEPFRKGKQARTFLTTKDGRRGLSKAYAFTSLKDAELAAREAEVLRGLDHPKISKCYDQYTVDDYGSSYFVVDLDFVEGESLDDVINREGQISTELAEQVTRETVEILRYLQSQETPVIHRDIKPGNLILNPETGVHLIDFGIVKQSQATISGSTMVGSPGYTAPEQWAALTVPKSDIFSLGATLYHALTGISPEQLEVKGTAMPEFQYDKIEDPKFRVLIEMITDREPEDRPDLDEIIKILDSNTALVKMDGSNETTSELSLYGKAILDGFALLGRNRERHKTPTKVEYGFGIGLGLAALAASSALIAKSPIFMIPYAVHYVGKRLLDTEKRLKRIKWLDIRRNPLTIRRLIDNYRREYGASHDQGLVLRAMDLAKLDSFCEELRVKPYDVGLEFKLNKGKVTQIRHGRKLTSAEAEEIMQRARTQISVVGTWTAEHEAAVSIMLEKMAYEHDFNRSDRGVHNHKLPDYYNDLAILKSIDAHVADFPHVIPQVNINYLRNLMTNYLLYHADKDLADYRKDGNLRYVDGLQNVNEMFDYLGMPEKKKHFNERERQKAEKLIRPHKSE